MKRSKLANMKWVAATAVGVALGRGAQADTILTFDALPSSLILREVRYQVRQRGFRSRQITLVTTLLDAECYPKDDLAELYFTRWEAETHLGQLKTTMKMDVLHCKTVLGVLKELTVFAMIGAVPR